MAEVVEVVTDSKVDLGSEVNSEKGFESLKECVMFLRTIPQYAPETVEKLYKKLYKCMDAVEPLLEKADKDLIAELIDALNKILTNLDLKDNFEKVEQQVLETIEKCAYKCPIGVLRSLCKQQDNLSVLLNRSNLIGPLRILILLTEVTENICENAEDKKNLSNWICMLQKSLEADLSLNPTHFLAQTNLESNVALVNEYFKFLSAFAKANDLEKLKELAATLNATNSVQIDFEALRTRFDKPNQTVFVTAMITHLKQFFSVKKLEENVGVERQIETQERNECAKKKGWMLLVLVISILVAFFAVVFKSGKDGDMLRWFFEEEKSSKASYAFWK